MDRLEPIRCGRDGAVFDNGFSDPSTVKRRSTSPESARCLEAATHCIGGPHQGALCGGDSSVCETSPGAGDGDCDACSLEGGLTTEDEMFMLLGAYFLLE